MPVGWWIAIIGVAALGAILVPALVALGMHQLGEPRFPGSMSIVTATVLAGAGAAALAGLAARRADSGWWLPGLFVWASVISAAATCDAIAQRIPTPLMRIGGAVSAALIVVASLVTQDWRALLLTLIAGTAAGAILLMCWRFADAGFGDVRLATVGGLGLGHLTYRSLAVGVLAFIVLTMAQVIWTFARTRDRTVHLPYGPSLVVGFLVAAAA